MKTKIFISLFLLISVTSFILYRPSERTNTADVSTETISGNSDGRFLIGAVNSSFDDSSNYVHYDSLGLDLWHTYTGTSDIDPVTNQRYPFTNMAMNDKLLAPVDSYKADIQTKINSIYSHNESRLMLMRPKIEWLCYGQRSDYQCEDSLRETALWFYSFQSAGHNGGVDSQDFRYADGNRVRYFRSQNSTNGGTWVDSIGTVISKLKANTEQCRKSGTDGGNIWQTDEQWNWYIKPRIRIDSNVAHSSQNPLVCKIKVIAENGATVLIETDIHANDFLEIQSGNYNGQYVEKFDGINLTIHGACGNNNAYWSARGNRPPQNEENKMDIQVYWYGNCDMWIDYIRVDNEVANRLLKVGGDNEYEQWLEDEVDEIGLHIPPGANTPPANKFYIELTEFNNYPCMAYVNKRLKYYSSDAVELIADWYLRNSIHVPWEDRSTVMSADFIKRFWIDSVGFKTFYAENYPYNSDTDPATSNSPGKIPSSLRVTGCSGTDPCGIMADPVPPAEFDNWLQDNMDHEPYYFSSNAPRDLKEYLWSRGSYRFLLNLGDNISKSYNIPCLKK